MSPARRKDAHVIELTERRLLEVAGPTRAKFLHNLLSSDVEHLQAGQGCLGALMDVKGHLLALTRALATDQAMVLELPGNRIDRVLRLLEHYRVAAPVRFAVPNAIVIGLFGADAASVLESAGIAPPAQDEAHVEAELAGTTVRVVRAGDMPRPGFVLHTEADAGPGLTKALIGGGVRPVERQVLDALRVEQGLPWYGVDVTEANLLHETGLVPTHHSSTKGCYVGQEVVARLEARGGKVNKALRGLKLAEPARPGQPIHDDEGKEIGRITTAAVSPRFGPIALAYIHRSRFEPGTVVAVNGKDATVVALPFAAPERGRQ